MNICKLAFVAFLTISTTSAAKETKLLITSGSDTQVVDFKNPDLACTLKRDYQLFDINDDLVIPYPVSDHCTVMVDDQVLLTGGQVSNSNRPKALPKVSKVAKFFTEDQWQSAPSMKVKRVNHGCGHFTLGQTEVFVVAGGENRFYELSSTEFSTKKDGRLSKWSYGPRLPQRMTKLTIVSAQDTVYILPAQPGPILRLKCSTGRVGSCRWIETGQKLSLESSESLKAEWIQDDDMVNCQVETTTTTTTTTTPRSRTTTVQHYDANNPHENEVRPLPGLTADADAQDICGLRFVGGASKIVGGRKANLGDWPWQISLRKDGRHNCGGSILNRYWIVTAAHCVDDVDSSRSKVRVGEHNQESDEEAEHTDIQVNETIYHERYTGSPKYDYDIAVLRLAEPIDFQPHVVPICLPPDNYDFTGKTGTVTGWGHERAGGRRTMILKQVNAPILSNEKCTEMFRSNSNYDDITDRMVCAGISNGGRDTCQADSGGPLVSRLDNGRFALAGVTSWGHGCGDKNQPGVYARVTELKDWVVEKTDYYGKP